MDLNIPIQHKRSNISGRKPQSGTLLPGQLAINVTDRKLFTKDEDGVIIELGISGNDLATVAFTGNYTDLSNLPDIPAEYILPNATADQLGGVTQGDGVTITNGRVSANVQSVRGEFGSVKTGTVELTRADLGVDIFDSNGLIRSQFIPPSVTGELDFQGSWDAELNEPPIPVAEVGNRRWYYIVSKSGNTEIDGISSWYVGDIIVSSGTAWEKISGMGTSVTTLNGMSGNVELTANNLPNLSLVGKTGQFTDLSGLPETGFPPSPHVHDISQIVNASLVANTGNYYDLKNLPADPRLKTISASVSGTPVMFPVYHVFAQKMEFEQNWVGSQASCILTSGTKTEVTIHRATKQSPTVFTQVGKLVYDNGISTFTTINPSPITFDVGDILQYEWKGSNIEMISISLFGMTKD